MLMAVVAGILFAPIISLAQSRDSLLLQIEALKAQLTQLQSQPVAAPNERPSPNSFSVNLSFGARGQDVIDLQGFLVAQGLFASDNATGYFGNVTLAAVKKFQIQHGIAPVSGYFGPLTRAKVNSIAVAKRQASRFMGCDTPPDCPDLNPFNVVDSFKAFTTSGQVPLSVSFSGADTAPAGTTYTIDFGDGQSQTLSRMICENTKCLISGEHVYKSVGIFTARLMRGTETAGSIAISVSEGPATSATLTVAPISGQAGKLPLNVTFTAAGTGGPFVIDFGDGQTKDIGHLTSGSPVTIQHGYKTPGNYFGSRTYTAKLLSNDVVKGTASVTVTDDGVCAEATKKLQAGQIDGTAFAEACF